MSKLPRLLAMPALVLVLSLSIFSMSAFARSVSLNAVHGALPSVTAQPADSMQAHDGPPPVGYGGGSGGSGGYGGYGGWSNHVCTNHNCSPIGRGIRKCFHRSRLDRSPETISRETLLACKWIKEQRW